jgi:L-alanine-DL-glutamate epimerase-like enolase superfamily enzyme
MPRVRRLQYQPLNVELTEPFGIATGAQNVAENVLVTLELEDGSKGYGEGAPFPAVSGETQARTLDAIIRLEAHVVGTDASRWRETGAHLAKLLPHTPAARAALETALVDAHCRSTNTSVWRLFGAKEDTLTTDLTITTGSIGHAKSSAARALGDGFATLKLKIGGTPDDDVARIHAVLEAAPEAQLILDANAALDAEQALALLDALGAARDRVVLFEQPVAAEDLLGLARVRERVTVAADESARSTRDVERLAKANAVDVINVKITKTGFAEALDMVAAARAHGLRLMIGGMVETRLAMSLSACLAAGNGDFTFVDLDTPLFMKCDPFRGGYAQKGPLITLDTGCIGLGIEPAAEAG